MLAALGYIIMALSSWDNFSFSIFRHIVLLEEQLPATPAKLQGGRKKKELWKLQTRWLAAMLWPDEVRGCHAAYPFTHACWFYCFVNLALLSLSWCVGAYTNQTYIYIIGEKELDNLWVVKPKVTRSPPPLPLQERGKRMWYIFHNILARLFNFLTRSMRFLARVVGGRIWAL